MKISDYNYDSSLDLVESLECWGVKPLLGLNELLNKILADGVSEKETPYQLGGLYSAVEHILSDMQNAIDCFYQSPACKSERKRVVAEVLLARASAKEGDHV